MAIPSKWIVAHAGGRSHARPNTLEAFADAIGLGADAIEFDVRRTADGELVVHHDESLDDRPLAAMDYQEVIRRSAAAGFLVPRLADLLDLANGRVRLDVELKERGYEELVARLLIDRGIRLADLVVTSFDRQALQGVRRANPQIRIGLLIDGVSGTTALEEFARSSADFLAPDFRILDEPTLSAARALGVEMLPWTVNDPDAIARLLHEPAVFGVISDETARALKLRDRRT